MTTPAGRSSRMPWNGWGPPIELPESLRPLLDRLGARAQDLPGVAEAGVVLPSPRLPADALAALLGIVGSHGLDQGTGARLRHAAGRSTCDLVRLRAGDIDKAPDAVLSPTTHEQVSAVLQVCSDHRIAVVPFGGGTSVVGGVDPDRAGFPAVVTLDLHGLNQLLDVDPDSHTATLQAGMSAPDAESALQARGFTLGHYPQSFEHATIGGFAATRSSGQASAGYGRFDANVVRLKVATPSGTLALGRAPASAAGPDLRQLILGSEGVFGVITEVTLRIRPRPDTVLYEAWSFPDFQTGTAAFRAMAQADALPTVARLADEYETALATALASSGPSPAGAVAVTIYEGSADDVHVRHQAASKVLASSGGTTQGPDPARAWEKSRFQGPYLRDALLRAGAFVETVETAATWSALPELYAQTRATLCAPVTADQPPPIVTCHISHIYPTGASLYFTVLAAAGENVLGWWHARKQEASAAIIRNGGTITHHHAVGTEHRPWMAHEIGDLGISILRAVKSTLDPVGILNPEKLTPHQPINGPLSGAASVGPEESAGLSDL